MRTFAKLTPEDKKPFFDTAAEKVGLPYHIVEKDFWVCWLLDILFSMDEIKDHLTFKGGTSLSKVYDKIRRFSEDVDISVEKSYLGFEGEKDPSQASGSKQRKRLLKELSEGCKEFVQNRLKSELENIIKFEFNGTDLDWEIEIDSSDNDGQTLLFKYPTNDKRASDYVRPSVKIEVGARADHWPIEMNKVISYVAQGVPAGIENKEAEIRVLSIERTFWEKATILHMFANYPEDKKVPIRNSRHYYDIYCLIVSDAKDKAMGRIDLLEKVAEHKDIYFRAGWTDYDGAKNKKTLKLIPGERVLNEMKKDYQAMEEMFFDSPPDWDEIISSIENFEKALRS